MKARIDRIVLLVVMSLGLALARPEPVLAGWQSWNVSQGLASNYVSCMFQDRTGALWFGTQFDGVSRYDGVNWKTYTTADGLPDNIVSAMIEDLGGALWFGSFGRGVTRYDGVSWRTFTTADGLASNTVLSMFRDQSGALWFGSQGQGVTRYDGGSWHTFTSADGLAGNVVYCILQDRSGALWFGTDGGVSRHDGASWRTFTIKDGLATNFVQAMHEDRSGALWFGTNFGVSRYDGVSWSSFTTGFVDLNVSSIGEGRSGDLWFGTKYGVTRYDGVNWRTFTSADGLAGFNVFSILSDRSGALWFGTDLGVSRYDGVSWHTFTTADGLADNVNYSMLEDRSGALWFGTSNGVTRYDAASWRTFTTADGLAYNVVTCMLEDRNGGLWFGGYDGVSKYEGGSWRTFRTADGLAYNNVTSIIEDRSGALWFGTYSGASRYDGVSWRTFTTADGLADNAVISMLMDRSGVLWFGTYNGVSRYDGTNWRTFTTADGLANNYVTAMLQDHLGVFWFGTNSGLSRYDGVSWRTFAATSGNPGSVDCLLEDRSGALWIGASGLSRYDGERWRTFTIADGLASIYVKSMLEDRTGALWFGTVAGVTRHTPDAVAPRSVFLTRPPVVSPASIPSISFVPAFDERNIQFQYSFEHEPWSAWSSVGAWPSRSLPDGQYKFQVQARDDYDNVESPPESLQFEIDATPPAPSVRSPGPDAAIRDSIAIRGTATDARFSFYSLDYRAQGTGTWIALADTMRTFVTDGVLGGWNTSGLSEGKYELRLSVGDTLGLVGRIVVPVSVDNRAPYAAQTSPALVTAAAGGDVYTDDAAAHLYIPPHGLARDTIVTLTALDTVAVPPTLSGGASRVNAGYEISWGSVALEKTATLDLAGSGANGETVYFEGADSTWQRLGGTVDVSRVTVPVTSAGRYAIFSESAAPAPNETAGLTGITFTPRVFSPHGTYAASEVAIGFTLGRPGEVSVRVFNRAGRLVREVTSGSTLGAGANVVRWDGRDGSGREVEDGAYLVAIHALGATQTRVLAVVK